MDPSPSDRGYRYLFYGDGFFINEQGYLVTAAHVLSQIRGGQPYILLRPPAGPPQFLPATLVALDRDHDVAVLRATPNPFELGYKVGFLPLSSGWLSQGRAVLAAALYPAQPLDAHTLDAPVDDRTSGQVFDFQFSQLFRGRGETELFLFNHEVRRGQSGAPVVSAQSREVVGFVEGQWLRSGLVPPANAPDSDPQGVGAAVPVHYAIALLQQKGIPWHIASGALGPGDGPAAPAQGYSPPAPLSLVASPYPSQSLFGGEVSLDALIDARGRLTDTTVVRGASPFLENVLSTVRTWSFFPARQDGHPVAARVGITFLFSQSYEPLRTPPVHEYDEPLPSSPDRGALPVVTVEPQYPPAAVRDGSVILYGHVGPQGQLTSLQILRDSEPLTPAALAAVHEWRFSPGRRSGTASDSAAIVVLAFRYTGTTHSPSPAK
ncbi:MAG TPA: energy transducer TonB [Candidatus Acidoferrales bacterium]|nr:energy transducer TonB [Candidatus Acidoferrales bacterium]